MGSIPLPALQTATNIQGPLDEYMRAAQLKSTLQSQQLQQQEIQVRTRQLQDQDALTKAMRDWNPDDGYDDLKQKTIENGGSGNAALQIEQHAMQLAESREKLSQEQRNNYVTNNKAFGDQLQGTENVPDEQLHDASRNVVFQAMQHKLIDTNTGQAYMAGIDRTTDPAQLRQHIDTIAKLHQGAAVVMGQKKTQAETEEAQAKTGEAEAGEEEKRAQTTKLQQETQGLVGPMAEAKYRTILTALNAGKQVNKDDLDFAHGYELANKKGTTQSDTLGVKSTSVSGPAGLSAISPRRLAQSTTSAPIGSLAPQPAQAPSATPQAAPAPGPRPTPATQAPAAAPAKPSDVKGSLVDMIGQYKLNPQMLMRLTMSHPEVLAAVGNKYPDWDQPNYNAKNHMLRSYTSGPESKSINAISTALGHAGELGTAIDALNNWDTGGSKTLRSLANRLGVEFGGDKVTSFNTIVHRLAPEISQAYVQGGGGEAERAADAKDFDASLGGNQLRNNLAETVKLLRSKISAQEQQWNNTFKPTRPGDDFSTRFLTPQAKDALSRYGGGAFGPKAGPAPKTAVEFMAKHGLTNVPQQTQ